MATYNDNCEGCGCGPSIPEPCVTPPPVCPDPQPCVEIVNAQCVKYTGPALLCNDVPIIPTNTSLADALVALVDLTCEDACCTIPAVTSIDNPDYIMLCVDDTAFCNYDGLLYNWYAITNNGTAGDGRVVGGIVNIDPIDNPINTWRVPNNNDWQALITAINSTATFTPWNNIAAGPMKSLTCWSIPNSAATNTTTLSVMPSVYRLDSGIFTPNNGQIATYWGWDQVDPATGYMYSLEFDDDTVFRTVVDKNYGLRIRLVRPAECNEDPGDAIPNAYKDNEGKQYNGIVIGNLVWLTEDLQDKQFNDADPITDVTSNLSWNEALLGAFCYPMNNQNYQIEYVIGCQQVKITFENFVDNLPLTPGGVVIKNDLGCPEQPIIAFAGTPVEDALEDVTLYFCNEIADLKICVVDITYQELYNKIVTETLDPCMEYRIIDYRSVNFINGTNAAYLYSAKAYPVDPDSPTNPVEVYVSEVEVLHVKALTNQILEPFAISEKYPEDIIQYEAFTNKLGIPYLVELYEDSRLPNGNVLASFDLQWDGVNVYIDVPVDYPILFGHMLYFYAYFAPTMGGDYEQDGVFEPVTPGICECQFPYTSDNVFNQYPKNVSRIKVINNNTRVLLLDLNNADYLAYQAGSLYLQYDSAIADAYGYIIRRYDPQRQIDMPFDFRNKKYRRFSINLGYVNGVAMGLGSPYYGTLLNMGLPIDPETPYIDVTAFGTPNNLYNVKWESLAGPVGWFRGFNDNVVFNAPCGYFGETCVYRDAVYDLQINGSFTDSTFGGEANTSVINIGYGSRNTFDSIAETQLNIGNAYDNVCSNGFRNNIINTNDFNTNTISRTFTNNTINASYFLSNLVQQSFRNNRINGVLLFNYQAIISDGLLPIYQNYNTDIVNVKNGSSTLVKVTYVDATTGFVVKDINTL